MNAFDAIAKKSAPTKTKTTKTAALVNDEIKQTVDTLINTKAELDRLTLEKSQMEDALRDHCLPQYDSLARSGSFTKTLEIAGFTGTLNYVTSDSFSVPKDEPSQGALRKLLGKKFNEFFSTERTISMKETAVKDPKTLTKISAACEKAGLDIASIFDVYDALIPTDDLDRKQFDLKEKDLDEFRTLVKQRKASLK